MHLSIRQLPLQLAQLEQWGPSKYQNADVLSGNVAKALVRCDKRSEPTGIFNSASVELPFPGMPSSDATSCYVHTRINKANNQGKATLLHASHTLSLETTNFCHDAETLSIATPKSDVKFKINLHIHVVLWTSMSMT